MVASFSSFGLSGTEVISDGLTTSFPAVNKIDFPRSLGTLTDSFGHSGTNPDANAALFSRSPMRCLGRVRRHRRGLSPPM